MRVIVIGLIFAAVILAGGTAYLLRSYLSSQEAEFASMIPKTPTTSVMVAAADMPVGTVINAKNIDWQSWPEEAIPEGFLVKSKNNDPLTAITKDKHVTRRAFTKGEPITMAKLYKSDEPGFLRGSLTPGMRAVAVKSNAETSASGFVLPGDRVDIMLSHNMIRRAIQSQMVDAGTPESLLALEHTSETIMENLRVLAVDQKVSEFEGGAVVAKTVLLEVTPKQAERLNTAKAMGKLSLVLRSAEEGAPRTGPLFTTDIEVSPILSALGGVPFNAAKPGGYFGDPENMDDDTTIGANGPGPTTPPQPIVKAAPAPAYAPAAQSEPSKRKITVYRGGGDTGGGTTTGGDAAAEGDAAQ